MKKLFGTVLCIALFMSCTTENDSVDYQQDNKSELTIESDGGNHYATYADDGPKAYFKIKAKLHRGQKWSEKHNVEPCTSGFGLCEVGIEVGVEKEVAEIVKSVNSTQAEIVFLQPVDQPDGAVFISSEDDNIDLPEEVANQKGTK